MAINWATIISMLMVMATSMAIVMATVMAITAISMQESGTRPKVSQYRQKELLILIITITVTAIAMATTVIVMAMATLMTTAIAAPPRSSSKSSRVLQKKQTKVGSRCHV